MWNAIAMSLKVQHLKERYPEVLAEVVLEDNKIDSAKESTSDSILLYSSTQSQSSGFTDPTSNDLSSLSSQGIAEQSTRGTVLFYNL